jgi:catechol 2,3-dioxygenase-like lactoylglutathione lyase family enzyme
MHAQETGSMIPVKNLFEAHLTVTDLDRAVEFYRDVLGLRLAHIVPARQAAFFWIGPAGNTMLGLWGTGSGPQRMALHTAFRVSLADVVAAPALCGLRVSRRSILTGFFAGFAAAARGTSAARTNASTDAPNPLALSASTSCAAQRHASVAISVTGTVNQPLRPTAIVAAASAMPIVTIGRSFRRRLADVHPMADIANMTIATALVR